MARTLEPVFDPIIRPRSVPHLQVIVWGAASPRAVGDGLVLTLRRFSPRDSHTSVSTIETSSTNQHNHNTDTPLAPRPP